MQKIINIITIQDFVQQFPRFSPQYLPVWQEGQVYTKGQIVYYNNLFYECIVPSTDNPPTITESWQLINQHVLNFTQDSDIINAFNEAWVNFNQGLFPDEKTAKLVFLYLTAFYLTLDFANATGIGGLGLMTSKSVGSVSVGYTIPPWINNNPTLSMYASNGYGIKYCTLIKPYLTGNIFVERGRITFA